MCGYVMIPRLPFNDTSFTSVKFPKPWALIDLYQMARYKDGKELVNGRYVEVKRGQLCKSIRDLAARWKWDEKTVSRFLNGMKDDGILSFEIPQEKGVLTRLISIVNYDSMSDDSHEVSHTPSHEVSHEVSHDYIIVNKEIKENKENKKTPNGSKEKRFIKPTIEEVQAYCENGGYWVDASRFVDYYESKGWKVGTTPMKDWKAAVRNWARKQAEQTNTLFPSQTKTPLTPSSAPPPSPQKLTYEEATRREIERIRRDYPTPKGRTDEEWEYELTNFIIPAQMSGWEDEWRARNAK